MRATALVMSAVLSLMSPLTAGAAGVIDTQPSAPSLVTGPFMISAYSFSGHNLNYVQLVNASKRVTQLDGWTTQLVWGGGSWELGGLSGQVAPGKKVTIADKAIMPSATFVFSQSETASEPVPTAISLLAPNGSGFSNHTVEVAVKSTTIKDSSTTPATYYFQRNISSSTGEYLTSFTATTKPTFLESDSLYEPPASSPLRIVEIYPKALSCSPAQERPECYDYIKLFNNSSSTVLLDDYAVKIGSISSSSVVTPSGEVASYGYAVVRVNLSDSGNNIWLEDLYGLTTYPETVVRYESATSHEGQAWAYHDELQKWQWTTPTPSNNPNQFTPDNPVNLCKGLSLSEIGANYDPQFIEVYNSATDTIDTSGCRLMTNRSQSTFYEFPAGSSLGSGQTQSLEMANTPLTLTKTTSGTVYLLSSDGELEVDARSYDGLSSNTSLALVGGLWQQTFKPTPGTLNVYQQYPPCQSGYERNEATGNCNKVALAGVVLGECPIGYYRNPETNRCKKVESSVLAALSSCPDGYYRNPETNRCKKIVTDEEELKPCGEGYERNPETNRCRRVLAAAITSTKPTAATADKSIEESVNVWIWAIMGIGAVGAISYGVYEWRHELGQLKKNVLAKFTKNR